MPGAGPRPRPAPTCPPPATRRLRAGERIDVRAIAAELGIGRATIYRWFASRIGLIGEVIDAEMEALVADARASAHGTGAAALLDTFQRMNRTLATAAPLHRFLEYERETGLRLLTSSAGPIQPRAVEAIAGLIEAEARAGAWSPPIDPPTRSSGCTRRSCTTMQRPESGATWAASARSRPRCSAWRRRRRRRRRCPPQAQGARDDDEPGPPDHRLGRRRPRAGGDPPRRRRRPVRARRHTASANGAALPYANPGALFDVTSGSNGTCSPSYLCTGQAGYDGPTGRGTPNGVGAF